MEQKMNDSSELKENEAVDIRMDLYVKNIPSTWTNNDLFNYFAKFEPRSANILNTGTAGFVNFNSNQNAYDAMSALNNQQPFPSAYFLQISYARNNSMRKGQNRISFWTATKNKSGRIIRTRDLNKLQQLILEHPNFAVYHYEYSLGLESLLDTKSKTIENPNLVQLWLKHINIAINLNKKQSKLNQPSFAWIKRKINFCIHLYQTDDNSHNIDIEELLNFAWNAVTNYNRYFFYLSYLRLLYITQREDLLTESLKLYMKIWNGNERRRYFQKYCDFVWFIECMTRNGCNLNEIVDVISECWKYYHNEYGINKLNDFNKLNPPQKTANFNVYLMIIKFTEYICNEFEWNVNEKILNQCLKWLEMVIPLRPYTGIHYIFITHCYFFKFNEYNKARNVLEDGIKRSGQQLIYNELKNMVTKNKKFMNQNSTSAQNQKRWKMLKKWVETKVFVDFDVNDEKLNDKDTPMMGDGGTIEPGSKLNIL